MDTATFKILIIGESGVGKTCLMLRYTDNDFNANQSVTIGATIRMKILNIDGVTVKLSIWDTAGMERFHSVIPNYFRDAQGAILVYDVTQSDTLRKLSLWLNELDTHCDQDIVKMIVGNKIDQLNEANRTEEMANGNGLRFARNHNMKFIAASAQTGDGVRNAFEILARKILESNRRNELESSRRNELESVRQTSRIVPDDSSRIKLNANIDVDVRVSSDSMLNWCCKT